MNEGDRLSVAIARAGNSQNAQADLNHVRLVASGPNGSQTTTVVNLYQAFNQHDQSADVALQKGDVVYVPQAAKHSDIFGGSASGLLFLITHVIP